jgi:hypothetical protein
MGKGWLSFRLGGLKVFAMSLQKRHHDQQRHAHPEYRPQVFMNV